MEEWNKATEESNLLIESIYNAEYELWEVSMDGQLLGSFAKEEDAGELVANIYLAFEHGFVNGVQLTLREPAQAQRQLVARGLTGRK